MGHPIPEIHTNEVDHHAYTEHDDFLVRFRQNLKKETKWALSLLRFIFYAILSTFLYGFIKWLFEFDEAKAFFAVIVPPIVVYLLGEYLTLIPVFFVVALMLVPFKQATRILSLAIVCSFFIIFLI
jgi:hypothetical protein